jgi:hypothetical protein
LKSIPEGEGLQQVDGDLRGPEEERLADERVEQTETEVAAAASEQIE